MADRGGWSTAPEFRRVVASWIAVRRVRRGGVRFHQPDLFTHEGRHLPEYAVLAMPELFDNGQVRLGDDRAETSTAVVITPSGEDLFAELNREHQLPVCHKNRTSNPTLKEGLMFTNGGVGVDSFVKIDSDGCAAYEVVGEEAQFRFGGHHSSGLTLVLTEPSLEHLVAVTTAALDKMRAEKDDSQTPAPAA